MDLNVKIAQDCSDFLLVQKHRNDTNTTEVLIIAEIFFLPSRYAGWTSKNGGQHGHYHFCVMSSFLDQCPPWAYQGQCLRPYHHFAQNDWTVLLSHRTSWLLMFSIEWLVITHSTSCVELQEEEEPQTAYPMPFTCASHIVASVLTEW